MLTLVASTHPPFKGLNSLFPPLNGTSSPKLFRGERERSLPAYLLLTKILLARTHQAKLPSLQSNLYTMGLTSEGDQTQGSTSSLFFLFLLIYHLLPVPMISITLFQYTVTITLWSFFILQ